MTKDPNGAGVIAPAVKLPKPEEGFGWALVSAYDDEAGEWAYVARARNEAGKLEEVARVTGCFFAPVPVTPDAAEEFLADAGRKITDENGKQHKLSGIVGAGADIAYRVHEKCRGMVRDGDVSTPEALQEALTKMHEEGRRSRTVKVSRSAYEEAVAEGRAAEFLAEHNVTLTD